MASNPRQSGEDPCNTETDDETMALRKKRSRRVSFADREITSVHIFKRDEEYVSPSDLNPPSNSLSDAHKEVLGFFRDLADTDDSKETSPNVDQDDDEEDARRPFFRPFESPSPGSSIFGSATSNDEDNFFGPVSTSFIRPGKQSGSAASDDNHDVTMDSTMFSMHYRSLARSDSGGNPYQDQTPSQVTTPSDSGTISMVLTKGTKAVPHLSFSERSSGGRDSNDMSLVGDIPRNYDYGKLSPNLEALLAISSKDLQDVSVSDSPKKNASTSSGICVYDENMGDDIDQRDHKDMETENGDKLGEGVSAVCMEMDELNGNSLNTLVGRDEDFTANTVVDQQMQTPNQLEKVRLSSGLDFSLCFKFHIVYHVVHVGNKSGIFVLLNIYGPAMSWEIKFLAYVFQYLFQLQVNKNFRQESNEVNTLNVEFPSGGHQSNNGEVPQLDSLVQHDSVENPNGSSHLKRRDNCRIDHQKSPVSAKQQEIYLDTAISSAQLSYVTPSPKQPNSFLGKGNTKSVEKFFSVNKNIPKFQIFEPSPLASALKERMESSKLRLSKMLLSTTLPSDAAVEESCKSLGGKNGDAVAANLEKRLFCIDANDRNHEGTDHGDSASVLKQKEYDSLRKDDQSKCLTEDGVSVVSMSTHVSVEGAHENCNNKNEAKAIILPDEFVSPTAKTLEKMSCSTKQQCTPLHDLQSDEIVSMSLRKDKSSAGKVVSNSNSTVITDVLREPFADDRAQSSSSLTVINDFVDFNKVGNFHATQNYPAVLKHAPEPLPIYRSPSNERNAQKVLSGSPDRNMLVATGLVHSEKEVPGELYEASPPASTRHSNRRTKNVTERHLRKKTSKSPIKELTHSPSRKNQHGVSDSEHVQSLAEKVVVSLNSNVNCHVDSGNHLNGIPAQNIENSSERKRRFEESVAENADKHRRLKRNPEIHTSDDANLESMLQYTIGSDNTGQNTRSDQMMKHWSDILQKFLKDTDLLLSPLTEKLNIKSLSRLQDIVSHLQKVKFFEMLHHKIQKISNQSSETRANRVTETKMLLYKLAYEKARLQLLSVEREKLLNKSQQLSSAVQKSQMLKLNRPGLLLSGNKDSAVSSLRCTSDIGSKTELSRVKLAAKKHEFEALGSKIKNLTKSLNSYLKLKGEPSFSEIMEQCNVHLKKKASCKIIRDDLKLWEIDESGSKNLKRSIALNYRGLLCQRYVINDGPAPSVSVSNNLDDISITKNFPNMDACTAFAWALIARSEKKLVGSKGFSQERQITCSVLHNLLDVIGEVQLASLQIRNLVQTRFSSSSVERLQLQLCFFDFNNGWKVMVALDMTCLKRGVYPSEVVPSQIEASFAGTSIPVQKALLDRITAAVNGLGAGYSRIIRLCRCISQAVCSPPADENSLASF
ncbi:hypothetical protein M5689_018494 [Euphorbia peplus]|nr:hypothetical protein M5689_018494 [Euphorbia peplus]